MQDERFEDVGDDKQVVWGLRRWMPEAAIARPLRLGYDPISYCFTHSHALCTYIDMETHLENFQKRNRQVLENSSRNHANMIRRPIRISKL